MAVMSGKNAISGSLVKCYVTIEGNRYEMLQVLNVKAKLEKTKKEVSIMGKPGKGNKSTGWKGTGSAKFHYNSSLFRELAERYKDTGEDIYFDMQVENYDPTSKVEKQVTILINCNFNSMVLANIDAEADTLDEEFDFTFEDFKVPTKFSNLDGMAQ